MQKTLFCFILLLFCQFSFGQNKSFYININGTVGHHTIVFKDYAKSSGLSFGYVVNFGIYAINKSKYGGGLFFSLLEAASRDENRREKSELFTLPNPNFDKHIIFKFAQFRSGNIGWFNEFDLSSKFSIRHSIGFGIFGTTEKDQLLDFGMNNQLSLFYGNKDKFGIRVGINFDNTFGTGNPNYLQRNLGISIGGEKSL